MADTPNRNYPLPDIADTVSQEFFRLQQQTLIMLDLDVHGLLDAISGLASDEHDHEIGDINGLSTALSGKMSSDETFALTDLTDVVGKVEAPDGYVLVIDGDNARFVSPLTVVGENTLLVARNLSDVQNAAAALINLKGVGYEKAVPDGNANILFTPGHFIIGDTWIGSPFTGANVSNQGFLEVQRRGSDSQIVQIFQSAVTNNVRVIRRRVAGGWEPWVWDGQPTVSTSAPTGVPFPGQFWAQVA